MELAPSFPAFLRLFVATLYRGMGWTKRWSALTPSFVALLAKDLVPTLRLAMQISKWNELSIQLKFMSNCAPNGTERIRMDSVPLSFFCFLPSLLPAEGWVLALALVLLSLFPFTIRSHWELLLSDREHPLFFAW